METNFNSFLRQARGFIQNKNFSTLLKFGFGRCLLINMEESENGHAKSHFVRLLLRIFGKTNREELPDVVTGRYSLNHLLKSTPSIQVVLLEIYQSGLTK